MTSREIFQKNFKRLFSTIDKKQEELAKDLGVSRPTISMWLAGNAFPRADVMERIADYFGVTVTSLITEQDMNLSTSETIVLDIYRQLNDAQKRELIHKAIELLKSGT